MKRGEFMVQRCIATLAREIYAQTSLNSIGEKLIQGIGSLVSCDHAIFVTLDVKERQAILHAQSVGELFGRHAPMVTWEHTQIFNEGWRPMGIHEQLAVDIPSGRPDVLGLFLNRSEWKFDDKDKNALNLLRPHISEACATARHWQRIQNSHPFSDADFSQGIIVLDCAGRPGLFTDNARILVSRYCAPRAQDPKNLPDPIRNWIDQQISTCCRLSLVESPRRPLKLRRGEAALTLRLISAADGGCHMLLMEEQGLPARNGNGAKPHRLTARESEVLSWIARGKTNEEIGIILGMSVHTAKTHVKRILAELGVETRTAAAAWALEQSRRVF